MAKRRSRKGGSRHKRKRTPGEQLESKTDSSTEAEQDEIADASADRPETKVELKESVEPSKSSRQRASATRRGRVMQPIRRVVLAVTLLSIFVLPLAQLALADERGAGSAQVGTLGPGLAIAASLPGLAALGGFLSGSVWSVTIAGFEIADPLAAALVVAAGRSSVLLAAALIPVAATLLLGRVFCGWICPARLPVELAAWIRRKTKLATLSVPKLSWIKYGVLVAGLILAALTGWNLVALIYPPAILVREAHYVLTYSAMGWGALVVGVAFVADVVVKRGAWCRGICPGGALYSLLGQPAVMRIRVDEVRCTKCRRCEKVCPMGLDPTSEPGGECDRCGLCQRECRDDALRYRLGPPFVKSRERQQD